MNLNDPSLPSVSLTKGTGGRNDMTTAVRSAPQPPPYPPPQAGQGESIHPLPPVREAGEGASTAALAALAQRLGGRVSVAPAVRMQHANTTTWVANQPPDAVAFPSSAEEVQAIVRICAAHGLPVIPFGVGTSLEGQVNAPFGGVSIDFRDMNRVLAVHPEDLDCVVEPGVTRKQLNAFLRDHGVFFPLDPGADASIG